jgi:2Fe-2S ferredoxin
MENNLAKIVVEDREGNRRDMEVPTDISMSLMEVLKGEGYPILATCGGMALCATCHVQVLSGFDALGEPNPNEADMLDTLPQLTSTSRLSCQISIQHLNDGMIFRVLGEDNS